MRSLRLQPLRQNTFSPPNGTKKIYLPNFTLTLLRNTYNPAHFASFLTPLALNKLDLKDYLYHAYGLKCIKIRSYVIQQRVTQDKPGARLRQPRRWFRPRAQKKMTVELATTGPGQGPFIYPPPPEDFSPWDKETFDALQDSQKEEQKALEPDAYMQERKETGIAAEARRLVEAARKRRSGEAGLREGNANDGEGAVVEEVGERWRPGWVDYGVGMEVERERWLREGREGRR